MLFMATVIGLVRKKAATRNEHLEGTAAGTAQKVYLLSWSSSWVFRFDYSDLAGTKIGGLFFGGKKWVRSLSSCEKTWSRVVSRNLNL